MNEPGPIALGIDLGTTYSAVSRLDPQGRPVTLVNAEGDLVTPSVLLFEQGNIVVGKEALKAVSSDAERVARLAKRELGERTFHQVLEGRRYPPEALQALILNKLRLDAEKQLGPLRHVVITAPAYFDEVRRKATQDAGYMAGFHVLDIINEPTAAAIAHGFAKGLLDEQGATKQKLRLLVYDLGGGTFDVTIMEVEGTNFLTLATDGDVQLGGQEWDQRILDYVAEEFKKVHNADPRDDANAKGRLWRDCEDAKRTLSARAKTFVACDFRGNALRVEVTRDQFEEMTRDLLDRTEFTTRQTLSAAGMTWKEIDHILLVGGSTRMPMVTAMLTKLSGKAPDASVAVDEAVAHGAALHAGVLLARAAGKTPAVTIKNVNSHSLGVVGHDSQTNRKRNAILIPRNTPLPVTAKRVFKTQKANQRSILVQIVEGESGSPDDCSQVGRCSVPDLPAGLPIQTPIEVRFHYQENGRLTVRVIVSGKEVQHEITRENSLTQEQLDLWRNFIAPDVK